MQCPNCHNDTGVTKTWSEAARVVRRRRCKTCGHTFDTTEYIADADDHGLKATIRRKLGALQDVIDEIAEGVDAERPQPATDIATTPRRRKARPLQIQM